MFNKHVYVYVYVYTIKVSVRYEEHMRDSMTCVEMLLEAEADPNAKCSGNSHLAGTSRTRHILGREYSPLEIVRILI